MAHFFSICFLVNMQRKMDKIPQKMIFPVYHQNGAMMRSQRTPGGAPFFHLSSQRVKGHAAWTVLENQMCVCVCVCGMGGGLHIFFLKIRKEESGGLRAVGSENSEVARTREEKE